MAHPFTPKKQVPPAPRGQQPTPPATQEIIGTIFSQTSEKRPGFLSSGCDTPNTLELADTEVSHVREPQATVRVSYCTETGSPLPHQSCDTSITKEGTENLYDEDVHQQFHNEPDSPEPSANQHNVAQYLQQHTEADIRDWMKSSKDPAQRKRRFDSLLHSFWPSNDEFSK